MMIFILKIRKIGLFNFLGKILLGYIYDPGGFIVTILIRLILYITSPPSSLLLTPLKAIVRGFLVLFHIGIWSPIFIYFKEIEFDTTFDNSQT
jgi:hypothetical protein